MRHKTGFGQMGHKYSASHNSSPSPRRWLRTEWS